MTIEPVVRPIACSTLAYAGLPLEAALAGIAEAGYRYVEIAAMPGYCDHLVMKGESEAQTAARVDAAVRQAGLKVISLSAHIDLIPAPPGHLPGFTSSEALEMLISRVRLAGTLGASVVNTQGANPTSAVEESLFLERLETVAIESQRARVTLALEVADGLTRSAASIQALMPRIKGAPVRINFDTGNLPFYSGLDPVREFAGVHQYVAHVHVKDHVGGIGDYNFPPIGKGNLDLNAFFTLVKLFDYRGPLSAEIEFEHPVDRPASTIITEAARASRLAMESYLAAT